MTPLSVPCPTCGQPAGSSCVWESIPRGYEIPHSARIAAAESEAARREEREQMQDWRNDSGV